jgi:ABC-type multidrug transport system fused ATPase/permease subunit
VDDLSKGICKSIAAALRSCSSSFGGTAMLVTISPQLTLVTLSLVPILACTAMLTGRHVKKLSQRSREQFEHVVGFADERLNMLRTVRLFGREVSFEFAVDCICCCCLTVASPHITTIMPPLSITQFTPSRHHYTRPPGVP